MHSSENSSLISTSILNYIFFDAFHLEMPFLGFSKIDFHFLHTSCMIHANVHSHTSIQNPFQRHFRSVCTPFVYLFAFRFSKPFYLMDHYCWFSNQFSRQFACKPAHFFLRCTDTLYLHLVRRLWPGLHRTKWALTWNISMYRIIVCTTKTINKLCRAKQKELENNLPLRWEADTYCLHWNETLILSFFSSVLKIVSLTAKASNLILFWNAFFWSRSRVRRTRNKKNEMERSSGRE